MTNAHITLSPAANSQQQATVFIPPSDNNLELNPCSELKTRNWHPDTYKFCEEFPLRLGTDVVIRYGMLELFKDVAISKWMVSDPDSQIPAPEPNFIQVCHELKDKEGVKLWRRFKENTGLKENKV